LKKQKRGGKYFFIANRKRLLNAGIAIFFYAMLYRPVFRVSVAQRLAFFFLKIICATAV